MNNKTINLENIYIKTEKNDKSLKNVIEQIINQYYKNNKISEEMYKNLGGNKNNSKNNCKEFFSDPDFIYKKNIICNSCKSKRNEKLTPNLPGIKCYYSVTSKSSPLNIKVTCAICKMNKNSFINRNTLPKELLDKIN
jgi:hypothetical protein